MFKNFYAGKDKNYDTLPHCKLKTKVSLNMNIAKKSE